MVSDKSGHLHLTISPLSRHRQIHHANPIRLQIVYRFYFETMTWGLGAYQRRFLLIVVVGDPSFVGSAVSSLRLFFNALVGDSLSYLSGSHARMKSVSGFLRFVKQLEGVWRRQWWRPWLERNICWAKDKKQRKMKQPRRVCQQYIFWLLPWSMLEYGEIAVG